MKNKLSFLLILIILFGCKSKTIQEDLNLILANLEEVTSTRSVGWYYADFERNYAIYPSENKLYFEACCDIKKEFQNFIPNKDTSKSLTYISNSDLKKRYYQILNEVKLIILKLPDSVINSTIIENANPNPYIDISNEMPYRKIQILTNLLSLQEYECQVINMLNCYLGSNRRFYEVNRPYKIISKPIYLNDSMKSTYLAFGITDKLMKNVKYKLSFIKLNGKRISLKYQIGKEDNFPTFSFVPLIKGIYEWRVIQYSESYESQPQISIFEGKTTFK